MKKIVLLMVVCVVASCFVGCNSVNTNKLSSKLQSPIVKRPVVTPNIELVGKVTGTATLDSFLCFEFGLSKYATGVTFDGYGSDRVHRVATLGQFLTILKRDTVKRLKDAAIYDALKKSRGAEIIIAPHYELEVNDFFFFSSMKCTVYGQGAKIKGISKIEYKDYHEMKVLNPGTSVTTNVSTKY